MKQRIAVLGVLFLLAATAPAYAKRVPPAPPSDPAQDVIAAEVAFDAYTFQHGYTHGFHAFSSPDALAFQPSPSRIHDELSAAIAKDPSEADAPSKLRWWPAIVGVAASGDLAYDLGGWTNGDSPKGGWFLTVWKKQPDGKWLWIMDTGAGRGDVTTLPPRQPILINFKPSGSSDTPKAAADEITQSENGLNRALGLQKAATAYDGFLASNAIVAVDGAVPALTNETWATALATRPEGLTWKMDGETVSAAGDFAYTYGHTEDAAHATQSHYVRVWRKDGPELADWHIVADVLHAAK